MVEGCADWSPCDRNSYHRHSGLEPRGLGRASGWLTVVLT